ncbi:hypothetical protein G9A89_003710 [Geosiphon pyriformis]|nr:hypothetical protein G9A89_003710 [Geosiphon pyriformis]
MAAKAKNSKKQQQAIATAMITSNPFVVSDKIFGKISIVAASSLSDMNSNSSGISLKMGQDQSLAVLPDVVLFSRSLPIPVAKQFINPDNLKDWADQMEIESTAPSPVSGAADGSLLSSLFQLLPGCIGLKSVSQDAVKLFCVEFAFQESLNGVTKVVISDEIFLTILKIAWSSGVVFVSSPSLLVVLHNVLLGTSSDDIKSALGIFDTSSAAAALSNWSVLIRKDSIRILPITNQKEVISSRDAFKAKLVNLLFGCTVFEINLDHLAVNCKKLPFLPPKLLFNTFGGPKNFKPLFVESKFYAKTAAFVVPPGTAVVNMNLDLDGPPKTTTPMLSAVPSVPNSAVKFRLASLKSHLSELSVLIKFLVKSVGALVVLVTKLLSTPSAVDVLVKECVDRLAKQNKNLAVVATMMLKRMTHLEKICEWTCLKDGSNGNNIVDDIDNKDNEDKDFSVYDNTFDVIIQLWKD